MWTLDQHAVPHIQTPLPGPLVPETSRPRRPFRVAIVHAVYPLVVARGSGAVIEDVDGNRFLDFTAGIAVTATGHCHPEVVAAIQDQAAKLIHMSGTDFYYQPQIDLAERLAEAAAGPSAKRVFFTNSGAEALEAALKLARWHTGRPRVIAFLGAFHGRTYGAMSLSGSKLVHRRGFSPLVPDIHHVPFPHSEAEMPMFEAELKETMHRVAPPDEVAAIFVEPIQGEGGYHVPPPNFCRCSASCATNTASCSSSTRCSPAWAGPARCSPCEHWNVEPDIVCLAKGIASGMPLGAIIAREPSWIGPAAVMPAPSAATRSVAGQRWRRSICCKKSTSSTPKSEANNWAAIW